MSVVLGANVSSFPSTAEAATWWEIPNLIGEDYKAVLERCHTTCKPQTYLEIGVSTGETLKMATCSSIGIDPSFQIDHSILNNKTVCYLYQMGSDSFFDRFDPTALFGRPIDMAFLDGMHWFEYLLRDFINTEKHCKPNSIVFLHDCMPTDEYVGRRDRGDTRLVGRSKQHPAFWAGDVWKTLAILLKYRPDLQIVGFDAIPTGLIAITRLNPRSSVLTDRYFDLVGEFKNRTLAEHGDAVFESLRVIDTRRYASMEAMSTLFWL